MKIEKISGILYKTLKISLSDINDKNIYNTKEYIENYFQNHGYKYIKPYDLESNLIVVQYKNKKLTNMIGINNSQFILNYKTNSIYPLKEDYKEVKRNINYKIYNKTPNDCLVIDDEIILIKPKITIISDSLISYIEHNITYIYDLNTKEQYPLYDDSIVYKDSEEVINPFSFLNVSNDNINIYNINKCDLNELINSYPYIEIINKRLVLINPNNIYGIELFSDTKSTIWYDTEAKRNNKYQELNEIINGFIKEEILQNNKSMI